MTINLIAELAPFVWGLFVVLLVMAGAIVASVDPELAEIYLGDRRLLAATVTLAALTGVALVLAPGGTGLHLP
jgi:hypothetical protein